MTDVRAIVVLVPHNVRVVIWKKNLN